MMASDPDRNATAGGGQDLAAGDGAELEVVPLGPPAAVAVVPLGPEGAAGAPPAAPTPAAPVGAFVLTDGAEEGGPDDPKQLSVPGMVAAVNAASGMALPVSDVGYTVVGTQTSSTEEDEDSYAAEDVSDGHESVHNEVQKVDDGSGGFGGKKRYATSTYLIGSKLLSNVKKKAEDIGMGVAGVTSDIGAVSGKVGGAAVSGVGAIGDRVSSGLEGAFAGSDVTPLVAHEVDTVTEVDVAGTVIHDLNREIAEQQAVGANTTDSPLNVPFVLLIAPILPLAIMYGWTVFEMVAPPLWNMSVTVWYFFGWRFWYCLAIGAVVGLIAGWGTIKHIPALRPITMQVEVHLVEAGRIYRTQRSRQLPKVYKAVDRILPPLRAAMYDLDKNVLEPRLGYSPLLAVRAKVYGWVYDARIASFSHTDGDARITISTPDGVSTTRTGPAQFQAATGGDVGATVPAGSGAAAAASAAGVEAVDPRLHPDDGGIRLSADRAAAAGAPRPITRDGVVAHPKAHNAAGDAADDAAEAAAADARAARILELARARPGAIIPEAYEKFFSVTLTLLHVGELHRKYQSVWLEWQQDGMVIDRSVIVDVDNNVPGSPKWLKGPGADFRESTLSHEVRLRYDPKRDVGGASVKHAHGDFPILLVLKGRDGMPLYSNDGARRHQRQHTASVRIAEICLSAKSAGVGHVNHGRVESDLCIPMHARGVERYRAAVLVARATIDTINASSYSYRQNLSPLPAGEWTVRVAVLELRNLRGVDLSGSSDPYVRITALGSTKTTDAQRKTLTCVVDQILFFSQVLTGVQMEQERVHVEVMDWNRFTASTTIGTYTVDARKILAAPGGEVSRKWYALRNPAGGKRPAGFVKLSIAVQPPGGELPAHQGGEDPDERTNASLLKNALITAPVMDYTTFAVHICVGWADMLPRMTNSGRAGALANPDIIRGYMVFEYTGFPDAQSRTFLCEAREVTDPNVGSACLVEPQRRLIWNEEYVLPLTVVNGRIAQDGVVVKLFHQESSSTRKFIGQVSLLFSELFANRGLAIVRGQAADGEEPGDRVTEAAMLRPRYYNFYGPPEGDADRSDKGIAFRGRVLMGAAAKKCDWPGPVLRTCPALPRPKLEFYCLDLAVLRATELPLPDGWLVTVHGRLGLFSFGHTIPPVSVRNMCATWDGSSAVRIPNIQFPEDVEQIPDLFITLSACKPKTVELLEDRSAADNARLGPKTSSATGTGDMAATIPVVPVADVSSAGAEGTPTVVVENATVSRGANESDLSGGAGVGSTDESSWGRFAFLRLSAKHLVLPQPSPKWMFMDYPKNDILDDSDKVPGSLLALASLRRFDPMEVVSSLAPAAVSGTDPAALAPAHVISEPAAVQGELPGQPQTDSVVSEQAAAAAPPSVAPSGAIPADATRLPTQPLTTNDAVEQPVELGNGVGEPGTGEMPQPAGPAAIAPGSATNPQVMAPSTTASSAVGGTFSLPLGMERVYELRALILQGRDLPAADETGLSDPFVHISMGDQFKKGTIIRCATVAPLWEELIDVQGVTIRDGERRPNVNVLVYDWDEDGSFDYLGRAIIPSCELDDIEPSVAHAKWYPVFSVNPDVKVGEILADFQLIEQNYALSRPITAPVPVRTQSALRVSLLGLRDLHFLEYASGQLFVACSVSGFEGQPIRSKDGAILQQRNYEGNCNILDILVLDIGIPEDLRLAPALNVYVYTKLVHKSDAQLLATTCIPLQGWLSDHERKLLSGVALIDYSFGMDEPVPEALTRKFRFRRHTHVINEKAGTVMSLHELQLADIPGQDVVPLAPSSERPVGEEADADRDEGARHLRVGFPDPPPAPSPAAKAAAVAAEKAQAAVAALATIPRVLLGIKYAITNGIASVMPDVALALGIDAEEQVPLTVLRPGETDVEAPYDGTAIFKEERGFCETELEDLFNEPAYSEFPLFRGDSRSLGAGGAALARTVQSGGAGTAGVGGLASDWFKRIIPVDEVQSSNSLKEKEAIRASLAGTRPPVGLIKARLDLVEVDTEDETELQKTRLTSLRAFGRVFVPTEVLVRVYVLRACHLQQVGSTCNPYLTARFYGGYPDFYSRKQHPAIDTEDPDFYDMFEARVKMPGCSVRIQVKDRVLPEVTVPIRYPTRSENGGWVPAFKQGEVPVNAGKLGLGWSEDIGETTIDLDSRWYNSWWRALDKSPVESRSLHKEGSLNARGSVELWVDIFDAKEVDKRPRMYRPVPVAPPPTRAYVLRLVIFKVADVMLPYALANYDPAKLAALKVEARLGNRVSDQRTTDTCRYVGDGVGPFNWRMEWHLNLPSVEIKPRLKLQVFDDSDLCGVGDIKLRTMFDEMIARPQTIIKNKQYVMLYHPNHPEVEVRAQIALEFLPAEEAAKKKCKLGAQAWDSRGQHVDYVLPQPFRPAAFSLFNPVPFVTYMISSALRNVVWQLVYVLLLFPFIPFALQMAAYTPWQWYLTAGMCGLVVFVRIMLVQASRSARMAQDRDDEDYERERLLLIERQTRLPLGESPDANSVEPAA
ncbi:hypothetical protein MMPV_005511 [Pyropia vietnamensis]